MKLIYKTLSILTAKIMETELIMPNRQNFQALLVEGAITTNQKTEQCEAEIRLRSLPYIRFTEQ